MEKREIEREREREREREYKEYLPGKLTSYMHLGMI